MELDELEGPVVSGVISVVIALVVTFGVAQVIPTQELEWALTAVGFASFFSGFFSAYRHQ
jgi:hypothetical protein